MELMQLQMAVAAAEENSLQRAAARVGRTPQAVSIAIAKLEDEVGVLLFDRSSGRGFRLTPEGDVFVDHAKRALVLLNEAVLALERIGSSKAAVCASGLTKASASTFCRGIRTSFAKSIRRLRLRSGSDSPNMFSPRYGTATSTSR